MELRKKINMNSIKVMSYNIRVATSDDKENSFDNRKYAIERMIEKEAPDLIGFQEVVRASGNWLDEKFGGRYTIIGCGRGKNYEGESCPIAFRKDKFALISFETVWLSDTPTVPGTIYNGTDQSKYPRIAHKVALKIKDTDKSLFFINTHLDHKGVLARRKGLNQLKEILSEGELGFLTGDFNAEPTAAEILDFAGDIREIGWADATFRIEDTFHDYGLRNPPLKIDYIFTNGKAVKAYAIYSIPGEVYLSDHNPICAEVNIG